MVDKTKLHDRQVEHRSNLPRLSDEQKPTLKQLLPQVDAELTPVFELRESATPDLVLNVGPGDILNTDTGLTRSFSPITQQYFKFTSGTVTFPATSGNPILVSPGIDNELIMPNDTYLAVLVQINSIGDLSVSLGLPQAVEADVLIAENFPVPNKKDLPIGYVVLHNDAGTIQPITNEKIVQFESGGGGGGAGDANELLERLKNRLDMGTFEYMTPIIFSTVEEDLTDEANTTAEYSVADSYYEFLTIGNDFVSVQMLDDEFLAQEILPNRVELIAYWNPEVLDTLATYYVSRDGGNEYQEVTMSRIGQSDTYRGVYTFSDEATNGYSQTIGGASDGTPTVFDDTNELSRQFTLANTTNIKKVTANLTKTGSPDGYIYAVAVRDDGGGLPSTDPADRIGQSAFIAMSDIVSGSIDFDINFTAVAENYHIVFKTDNLYKASYAAGVDEIAIDDDGTGIIYTIEGLELILKIKVTGGTVDAGLNGLGIYYKDEEIISLDQGSLYRQLETFDGTTDNFDTFTLSFLPDPRLLNVYALGTGQVFRYGDFVLNGNQVVFPPNTFNIVGQVSLEFLQVRGNSFDNSDRNAALMAANFLGSIDSSIDLSQPGRGFHLRSPDGTLYEVTIKNGGIGFDIYEVT